MKSKHQSFLKVWEATKATIMMRLAHQGQEELTDRMDLAGFEAARTHARSLKTANIFVSR